MSGKTNYLENLNLNALKAMTTFVGLFSGDPTDTGAGGSEVTTTLRAAGRVAVTFGSITSGTGANSIANSGELDFGDADAGATITHFGVFDAASSGNLLYAGALGGGSKSIDAGEVVKFPAGSLVISED